MRVLMVVVLLLLLLLRRVDAETILRSRNVVTYGGRYCTEVDY